MRAELRLLACFAAVLVAGCQKQSAGPEIPQTPRQSVEAKASVDPAVATTGDLVTYAVTVDARSDVYSLGVLLYGALDSTSYSFGYFGGNFFEF